MTMARMVEYLENRGFKTERRYERESKKYIFTIEDKDGFKVSDTFLWIPGDSGCYSNHARQENFLDNLINKFKKEKAWQEQKDSLIFNSAAKNAINDYVRYDLMAMNDLIKKGTAAMNSYNKLPSIQKVIYNPPATIIFWADKTKTVVQTQNGEPYDPEKGFAMAVTKKVYGNKGNYFNTVKKWTEGYEAAKEEETACVSEPKMVYKVVIESANGTVMEVLPHDYASKSSANRKAKKLNDQYNDGYTAVVKLAQLVETYRDLHKTEESK